MSGQEFCLSATAYIPFFYNPNSAIRYREMLLFLLIGLSLALAGVAGLQFMYLFYLDRLDKERKKRLHELERRCTNLKNRLSRAEDKIAEQNEMLEALSLKTGREEEAWADVIEEN